VPGGGRWAVPAEDVESGEEGGAGQGHQASQQLQADRDHAPNSGGQEPVVQRT